MGTHSVLNSGFQYEINLGAKADGYVYLISSGSAAMKKTEIRKIAGLQGYSRNLAYEKKMLHFTGQNGPVWILQYFDSKKGTHGGLLDESAYGFFRDQTGGLLASFKTQQLERIELNFVEASESTVRAAVIGLELAAYNFLNTFSKVETKKQIINLKLSGKKKPAKLDTQIITKFQHEASAVQLARHLVNLPPNEMNPETLEALIKYELNFPKSVKLEVWGAKRLETEGMNLLLAVGKGSETPARMVHIKYRPTKKSNKKPIAFVGKGITFDTGGLDIKPSGAMRLMKKDMGGAAAVVGLAYWAIHTNYERPLDFYLALAENCVDSKAMRPGDIYRSRAGLLVEIDNTDAEGRLVLADVMDVAATKKGVDEPEFLIDIATLTGAIKVALGADVAGLFTNDDQLAAQIQAAGQASGEPNWRMPLVQKYFSSMSSNFADFKNSADGFGGAITAALFLEKFCGGKKWAHLDVYSWNDKATGALSFAGGNGQPVQSMITWLKTKV